MLMMCNISVPFILDPSDVHSSITHLHGALLHISSRLTSYLLTLNSSKTELLFVGLEQQLVKPQNISKYSARNLGFIVVENPSFDHIITL